MTEYIDSFGIYAPIVGIITSPSQLSLMQRWNSIGFGNLTMGIIPGLGARGNPVLWMPFGASLCKTHSHQDTFIQGLRVNMSSLSGVGGAGLFDFSNCDRNILRCKINADGSISVYADPDATTPLICTTGIVFTANTDAYLELSAVLTGTTNINVAAQVWVNGILVGSGNTNSNINKNNLKSLSATFNRIFLYSGVANNGGAYISDYYLNNATGSFNNGPYLNPTLAIDAYPLPNGDSTPLQWTPLGGGGTHYTEINELPSDGDASYVASSTPGQIDNYDWQDVLSFSGTVKSVQLSYCARTTDEGNRSFRGNVGVTEAVTPTFGLPGNYQYFHTPFDVDPATGIEWTRVGFNAKQFGIELIS